MPQRPHEFRDRVAEYVNIRAERLFAERIFGKPPQYETANWESASRDLQTYFDYKTGILEESALNEIEEFVRHKADAIRYETPGSPDWGADTLMARCCYMACRLRKPEIVVETGVAYGVTSAFILKALEENGRGVLHSVDLPALRQGFDRFWGIAVPQDLKIRWNLYRGDSKHLLPKILGPTSMVDVFVRDSSSTYRSMKREYEMMWPYLRTDGIIVSNQVEWNRAFSDLQQRNPAYWRVVRDFDKRPVFNSNSGDVFFGIAIK